MVALLFSELILVLQNRFVVFPGVLEGLGRSGRLVGTIFTYPGTYKCPGSRVMAQNPGGEFFIVYGISHIGAFNTMNQ